MSDVYNGGFWYKPLSFVWEIERHQWNANMTLSWFSKMGWFSYLYVLQWESHSNTHCLVKQFKLNDSVSNDTFVTCHLRVRMCCTVLTPWNLVLLFMLIIYADCTFLSIFVKCAMRGLYTQNHDLILQAYITISGYWINYGVLFQSNGVWYWSNNLMATLNVHLINGVYMILTIESWVMWGHKNNIW